MQCPRCHFENTPGQSRCFKCGSVLDAKEAAVNVHPPRMAKWKKPFRAVMPRLRRQKRVPQETGTPEDDSPRDKLSPGTVTGLILSIIPGLAHLVAGRFSRVRWYCLAWLILLAGAIFLLGSAWGFAMLGLAIGIHAWVAFTYTLNKDCIYPSNKVAWLLALLVVLGLLYWGIRRTVFYDFLWAYTGLTIPYQNVESGDCLLARRSSSDEESIKRGSLVLIPLATAGNVRGRSERGREIGRMIVQVIALPGEEIDITEESFFVDGERLDPNEYPVPQWLRRTRKPITIEIPQGRYFVTSEYNVAGGAQVDAFIRDACIVRIRDIEARAIMVWFPVNRRGFLKTDE